MYLGVKLQQAKFDSCALRLKCKKQGTCELFLLDKVKRNIRLRYLEALKQQAM